MTKFVVMRLQRWDKVQALTPEPRPILPENGKSVGFLLVYDTLTALRADWPKCKDYIKVKQIE